jgi:hypothetical protein
MRPEQGVRVPDPADVRENSGKVVLRPGIAMPVMGYACAVGALIAGVIFAYYAHKGGDKAPMPPAGDWSALGDRLIAGCVLAVACWAFYKAGSQRVVLDQHEMRIFTWGAVWTLPRDAVSRVLLTASALTIVLADGTRVRPSTFWSSPTGVLAVRAGLFGNFASRQVIAKRITEWRSSRPGREKTAQPPEVNPDRYWRTRLNIPVLVVLLALVVAEAVIATAVG